MPLEGLRLIGRCPLFRLTQIIGQTLFEDFVAQIRRMRFGIEEVGQHDAQAFRRVSNGQSQWPVGGIRFLVRSAMRVDFGRRNGRKAAVCEAHHRTETV